MAEEVSPEVLKKTQKALGKYIKKPPLTDKLLKKPPFRFLHDVIHAVISETGFLKGLYSEEELDSENLKDKDGKIAFLNKLIEATNVVSQSRLAVKASKIVAGLEPTNTNLLLQAIAKSIDSKVNTDDYISQLKSSTKKEKPKKVDKTKQEKSKTVAKASTKDEKDSKVSKGTKKPAGVETPKSKLVETPKSKLVETPKSKLDTPKGSKGKLSSRKVDESKHKTGRRAREDTKTLIKYPKSKESPKGDAVQKVKLSNDLNERRSSYTEEKKDSAENIEKKTEIGAIASDNVDLDKIKDYESADKPTEPELQKESTNEVANNNIANKGKDFVDVQNEKTIEASEENTSENTKSLVRPKSARPKSGDMKKAPKEELSQPKPVSKSTLRPPSVRPSSARPGAPRLRPDSALPIHEPVVMGNINVIVENIDTTAVDEEETVVIEIASSEPEIAPEVNIELDNKSHLVEQILEQFEESGGKKHTEIDWEPDVSARTKEETSKDVTQLANTIQTITKAANPLGKLINYLHEDIEAMHSELQIWVNTKKQLYDEIAKQKKLSTESDKPLLTHLETLNKDIKKLQQEVVEINGNIIKNDIKIKDLLCK